MATSNHAAARTVREFVGQQLPIIAVLIVAGFVAAFWEYGYIPVLFGFRGRRRLPACSHLRHRVATSDLHHGGGDHSLHSGPFARRNSNVHIRLADVHYAGYRARMVVGLLQRGGWSIWIMVGIEDPAAHS